jgi:hypothetical protein
MKPLPFANGSGRNSVTPERALVSVGKCPSHAHRRQKIATASLLELLRNGRFTSETAAFRCQKRKSHLDPEVV